MPKLFKALIFIYRSSKRSKLHDNVGQLLTAAKLVFETAKERCASARGLMQKGIAYLLKAVDENRRLAHAFVTPLFDGDSFDEEIYGLLRSMLEPQGIRVVFDPAGFDADTVSADVQLALYRIVQEQCTNVVKHSGAKEVRVWLRCTQDGIELAIRDSGKGVDKTAGKGIGLRNMRHA